jgi:hypothetical protein
MNPKKICSVAAGAPGLSPVLAQAAIDIIAESDRHLILPAIMKFHLPN